jgi:hypothetical protein
MLIATPTQMCQVAAQWDAAYCLTACLERLAQVPDGLSCDQLAELLTRMPHGSQLLLQHKAWEQKVTAFLVSNANAEGTISSSTACLLFSLFADVHSLLTSPAKLKLFHQLPYAAIKAWAGSDDLVVDSENSVAVALGSWISAQKECSTEQRKELSRLVRVKHLGQGTCSSGDPSSLQQQQGIGQGTCMPWFTNKTSCLQHSGLHCFRVPDLHTPQAQVV